MQVYAQLHVFINSKDRAQIKHKHSWDHLNHDARKLVFGVSDQV